MLSSRAFEQAPNLPVNADAPVTAGGLANVCGSTPVTLIR
jgi:hypothetical protein